jgi:hypothetical protein
MLADPLNMFSLANMVNDQDCADFSASAIDLTAGKSIRLCSVPSVTGKGTLSISHSESKENVGQITDRAAVRLEVRRTSDEGVDTVAQVTVVASIPRSGFTLADVENIFRGLVGTLIATKGDTDGTCAVNFGTFSRIIAGEP